MDQLLLHESLLMHDLILNLISYTKYKQLNLGYFPLPKSNSTMDSDSDSEDSITIPPEIITDILYRLPAKSLGRFRCVSKDWLSLISEPQFIKTHTNTLNRNHLIFTSNEISLYSLPSDQSDAVSKPKKLRIQLPPADVFTFHGSCDGLVLGSADCGGFDCVHTLVVLNPTTSEIVKLPESGYEMIDNLIEVDIIYGFGYDSLTDDYKIVTISYFHYNDLIPPDVMSVHVYSLKSKTWRWVIDSPYDHSYGKCLPGVLVNGFLHWIAIKASDGLPVIVAFSLADERFIEVPLPELSNDVNIMCNKYCKLVALGEKLCLFLEVKGEVWLMNEYRVRESWIKIEIQGLNETPMVEPLIFYEDGKILLVSNDGIWIYDVEERTLCRNVDVSWNVKALKVRCTYVESLISPKFS